MSQYGLWEVPFASLYRIELDMLGTCLELLVPVNLPLLIAVELVAVLDQVIGKHFTTTPPRKV